MVELKERKQNQARKSEYMPFIHPKCVTAIKAWCKCHYIPAVIMKIHTNEVSNCVLTKQANAKPRG